MDSGSCRVSRVGYVAVGFIFYFRLACLRGEEVRKGGGNCKGKTRDGGTRNEVPRIFLVRARCRMRKGGRARGVLREFGRVCEGHARLSGG